MTLICFKFLYDDFSASDLKIYFWCKSHFPLKKLNRITLTTGNGQTDTQTQYCCSFAVAYSIQYIYFVQYLSMHLFVFSRTLFNVEVETFKPICNNQMIISLLLGTELFNNHFTLLKTIVNINYYGQ